MAAIDYRRFERVLVRSEEIAGEPGAPAAVKRVYGELLKTPADAFRAAQKAAIQAESAYALENQQATAALLELDRPYSVARNVVRAFVPTLAIPESLKSKRTDTDRIEAIDRLLDALDDHANREWAAEQLAGEFGQQAPGVIQEIEQAIQANKDLTGARAVRAAAYGPAYEQYRAFKRVVREAFGPKSKQYQRIHIRVNGTIEEDEPSTAPAADAGAPAAG